MTISLLSEKLTPVLSPAKKRPGLRAGCSSGSKRISVGTRKI